MESNKSCENLIEVGFMQEQIECLRQLRRIYIEREQAQVARELRRLEFVRWLVSTGRLTDDIPRTRTL